MKIDTLSPCNCYRLHRLSSILVGNSWKRIPSIFRLAPGLAVYTACWSCQLCNLLLSLMCELAVFVKALLCVILKARAIFISVTVLLATLLVAQAKKFTVKFIDVQVALWMQQTFIVVVETLSSSLTLRCYRFTELKNTNDDDTVNKAM